MNDFIEYLADGYYYDIISFSRAKELYNVETGKNDYIKLAKELNKNFTSIKYRPVNTTIKVYILQNHDKWLKATKQEIKEYLDESTS